MGGTPSARVTTPASADDATGERRTKARTRDATRTRVPRSAWTPPASAPGARPSRTCRPVRSAPACGLVGDDKAAPPPRFGGAFVRSARPPPRIRCAARDIRGPVVSRLVMTWIVIFVSRRARRHNATPVHVDERTRSPFPREPPSRVVRAPRFSDRARSPPRFSRLALSSKCSFRSPRYNPSSPARPGGSESRAGPPDEPRSGAAPRARGTTTTPATPSRRSRAIGASSGARPPRERPPAARAACQKSARAFPGTRRRRQFRARPSDPPPPPLAAPRS